MSGFSVKRNEIIHLDSYNKVSAGDDSIPLLRQLFLDLVGDGSDKFPNHGFIDQSPFITKIEIDDEILVNEIIENYIKKYYQWRVAGYDKYVAPSGGTVTYKSTDWFALTDTDFETYGIPNVQYPRVDKNYYTMSKQEWDKRYPTTVPSGTSWQAIEEPSKLFAFAGTVDETTNDIDFAEAKDSTNDWLMPVVSKLNMDGDIVELVADELMFSKEIKKIINIITNQNRGNTISTNGLVTRAGVIKQYKYINDTENNRKYHSFWVMTNKDDPLFQNDPDQCWDSVTQTNLIADYPDENTCKTAGFEWKIGNAIPLEQMLEVNIIDGVTPNVGHKYEVTISYDQTFLSPTTGKPYGDDVFTFYNYNYFNTTDDFVDPYYWKFNLWSGFRSSSAFNKFIVDWDKDLGILTFKDKIVGRAFTVTVKDLGRETNQGDCSWSYATPGLTATYNYRNVSYVSNWYWSKWQPYGVPAAVRTQVGDLTSGVFQVGNEYAFTLTLYANASAGQTEITEQVEYSWSYLVTDNGIRSDQILTSLVDNLKESGALQFGDYTLGVPKLDGGKFVIDFTTGNEGLGTDGRQYFIDPDSGNVYDYRDVSISRTYTYPNYVYTCTLGAPVGTVTFEAIESPESGASGDLLFEADNLITQQAQKGANNKISFNFHMWKDMFFSDKNAIELTYIDYDALASWDDQPRMSFDTDFTRVIEVTDHSIGPLVLEAKPSEDLGFQLSGKVLESTSTEKPQTWRIRFDVNRGTELRNQSKNMNEADGNKTDKAFDFEYLEVNIGTPYQLLSNGGLTKLEGKDGLKPALVKSPGYLGFVRDQVIGFDNTAYKSVVGTSSEIFDEKDYTFERIRLQKGFFRRSTKTQIEYSYPMNYRLTVAPHGMFFHIADDASVDQSDDFAWFVVQRHVEPGTGAVYTEGTAPLHCVYMSSEPPTYLADLDPFFESDPYQNPGIDRIENIFDQNGFQAIANFGIPRNREIGYPDLQQEGRFRRFVVREKNVLKPWDVHKLASVNTIDSNAIIHANEQLSMTERNKLTINFPNRLCTQSFVFTNSELDIIAYCDAGVIGETTYIASTRYNDNRVYEALKATKPNGNGMRILALVQGDIVTDSDIDPTEVLNTAV